MLPEAQSQAFIATDLAMHLKKQKSDRMVCGVGETIPFGNARRQAS
jgi:hypothetical protein